MDRLQQIEVLARTVELGSLSRAAEGLGMSVAAASRHLTALEHRLGARLLERNSRRLWLTEAGEAFLARAQLGLAELAEAEDLAQERALSPVGLLRVTSSLSFAVLCIAPHLPVFRARYPRLRVQVTAANRYSDFIEAGMDVAVRTRLNEPDSAIMVRRLGTTPRMLAASPEYLARHGAPREPAELRNHDLLVYNLAAEAPLLRFSRAGQEQVLRLPGVLDSNDGQVLRQAALAGLGILVQPEYIIAADLRAGRLCVVMPEWALPLLTINIAWQNRAAMPSKIRAFVDFVAETISADPHNGIA
jgi:DNA-binding transcriptional LysR family regulator